MKTVFLLFDSLNRRMLDPYGSIYLETPNFKRLAKKTIIFDNHYIGSMPCMPARRDMQTGRLSFLHRSWGPLEPFDNSFPETMRLNGIYTHLVILKMEVQRIITDITLLILYEDKREILGKQW